jgi:hypothetical protein
MKRHGRRSVAGAGLACALTSVACSNGFEPASRVTQLRVLAVHADLPYAHPGETVALDALAHDPDGRTLTWGFATCEDPVDSSTLGCLEALRKRAAAGESVRLSTGEGLDHFTITIPDDALTHHPEPLPGRALLGVVTVVCPGTLEEEIVSETTAADPLPIVCRDDAGARLSSFDFVVGMKRVFVRESDRNANPEIERITFDGKEWPDTLVPVVRACGKQTNNPEGCAENLRHRIRVQPTPESTESGTDETGDPFEEQLVVQYYASDGTFGDGVRIAPRPETQWVATPGTRGAEVRFWLVVRDDRGGVTWAERRVSVER